MDAFAAAFDDWMQTQVESDHVTSRGLLPTVWPADGQNPAVARERELKVAETAGAAARAVAVTGMYTVIAGFGALDPLANWFTMSSPKALLSPHDLRSTAAGIKGRLNTMIAEAEGEGEGEGEGESGFLASRRPSCTR